MGTVHSSNPCRGPEKPRARPGEGRALVGRRIRWGAYLLWPVLLAPPVVGRLEPPAWDARPES